MNIKPHIPKPKLMLLLSILIARIIGISIPTIQVYATRADRNGTDDESGSGTRTKAGWPSASKTGWLIYLVTNDDDEVVSDVVAITCGGVPQGTEYMTTRIGNLGVSRRFVGGIKWVPDTPYDTSAHPHGGQIKDWMLTEDSGDVQNWFKVVKDYWGEEKALSMAKDGYSLIMEPFYWANIGNG